MDTAADGVWPGMAASESWLASFGWPGSSADTSVASTCADWATLEYAIWVR